MDFPSPIPVLLTVFNIDDISVKLQQNTVNGEFFVEI